MRSSKTLGAALAAGALSLSLAAAGAAAADPSLTNAAFFDADASGSNTSGPAVVTRGGWTTVLDQQNVPSNFAAEFFLSKVANPTAGQFLTPSAALSAALTSGANTFYFFADSDDPVGGAAGFGLNLYLDGASAGAPSISAFVAPGVGGTAVADGSTGCTSEYTLQCVAGAGTLSFTSGGTTITLSDFEVFARGGPNGTSTVDLVNSSNSQGFVPPPQPDGITDTYGSFTLNVTTQGTGGGAAPEPASWALMLVGFGGLGAVLRAGRARRMAGA